MLMLELNQIPVLILSIYFFLLEIRNTSNYKEAETSGKLSKFSKCIVYFLFIPFPDSLLWSSLIWACGRI